MAGIVILSTATAATVVARALPTVGAPALALVLGVAARPLVTLDRSAQLIVRFGSKRVLQAAIVLLGATFSLRRVAEVGRSTAPLMLATLAIALVAAALLGRFLRVPPRLTSLIGVGTAICGASAIGAVSGIVAASEAEIAYAISTIFVFNIAAVLTFPLIGHALGLSQHDFGVWAGTAVNDTSSVVAAAYTYGNAAGTVAVVTKLARTTMIVPISLALAAVRARSETATGGAAVRRALPLFLIWFLAASALNTAGAIPADALHTVTTAASFLIAVALASIGLSTAVDEVRRAGFRPLLLGASVWVLVAASSLVLQGAA